MVRSSRHGAFRSRSGTNEGLFGRPASRPGQHVGWVEPFAKTHRLNGMRLMGIAEFIIGPACGRTRWLRPSCALVRDQ